MSSRNQLPRCYNSKPPSRACKARAQLAFFSLHLQLPCLVRLAWPLRKGTCVVGSAVS